MIKERIFRSKILFWLGAIHFIIALFLFFYAPFNVKIVLGLNSVIKPMKFALSIGIYSWTMALILAYLNDVKKVKVYSWIAVICMGFEQLAITSQALRGELSHFNKSDIYGMILFSLMGLFILAITLWTAYMTYLFFKQKVYNLHPDVVLSIKFALVYFIIFSSFGGYVSSLQGHTIGAKDGGEGLFFLNWSRFFGDLRVAHFFGIHSLQVIPLFTILMGRFSITKTVWLFSILYLTFVLYLMYQGLMGLPFV
jgi:hypothetical protein